MNKSLNWVWSIYFGSLGIFHFKIRQAMQVGILYFKVITTYSMYKTLVNVKTYATLVSCLS